MHLRELDREASDPACRTVNHDGFATPDLQDIVDPLQRRRFPEALAHGLDLYDAHAKFSGARRTTSFSVTKMIRKNEMPSAAAITFVAHSPVGWVV